MTLNGGLHLQNCERRAQKNGQGRFASCTVQWVQPGCTFQEAGQIRQGERRAGNSQAEESFWMFRMMT
jgi:hypothetical protein